MPSIRNLKQRALSLVRCTARPARRSGLFTLHPYQKEVLRMLLQTYREPYPGIEFWDVHGGETRSIKGGKSSLQNIPRGPTTGRISSMPEIQPVCPAPERFNPQVAGYALGSGLTEYTQLELRVSQFHDETLIEISAKTNN